MSGNSNGKHNGVDIRSESPLETLGNAVSKAIDPYGVTTSMLAAQMAWLMHPQELARAANALYCSPPSWSGIGLRAGSGAGPSSARKTCSPFRSEGAERWSPQTPPDI